MNRLAYPGSPDRFNGAEDTSHIEQNLAVAENSYRHYIKHGSLLDAGSSPANASGSSSSNPIAGITGAQTNGASKGLSVKKQLLLLPLVIAVIVVLAIAYVAAKDALFGDKSNESAASTQPAAEAPAESDTANGGDIGATGEGSADDTQRNFTPSGQIPAPLADFVRTCSDYDVVLNYYGTNNSPAPKAKGSNCAVDATKAPEVGYALFTDDPAATAAVREGKPLLDGIEIPAESTRGSTFKAQRVESLITVAEILPDNQGIVEYLIKNDDPEVAKKALTDLGVAK